MKEYILLKSWTSNWRALLKDDELNERLDKETSAYALQHYDVVVEKYKEMYDDDYKSKLYAFSNKQIVKF